MNCSRPREVFVNDTSGSPFYIEITDPHLNYKTKDRFCVLKDDAKILNICTQAFYHDYQFKVCQYPDHPLLQISPHNKTTPNRKFIFGRI